MSGPQGSDPNPWQGQDQPAAGGDPGSEQPPAWQPQGTETPAWQPPAYTPGQYPQYGQPVPGYPPTQPYTETYTLPVVFRGGNTSLPCACWTKRSGRFLLQRFSPPPWSTSPLTSPSWKTNCPRPRGNTGWRWE